MPDSSIMRLTWLKNKLLREEHPQKETLKEINRELEILRKKLEYLGEIHGKRR